MSGETRRPYCPHCGSKNISMTAIERGFVLMDDYDTLDKMSYVKCNDCGWTGTRYDCKEELPNLCDDYFKNSGFEMVDNNGNKAWRLPLKGKDYSIMMTYNKLNDSWIYSDYRNVLYDLRMTDDLRTLLKLIDIEYEN